MTKSQRKKTVIRVRLRKNYMLSNHQNDRKELNKIDNQKSNRTKGKSTYTNTRIQEILKPLNGDQKTYFIRRKII